MGLVAGERVGHDVDLHILHALDEPIETLGRVVEQGLPRDDQLPLAVPDRTPDEPGVGELRARQASIGSVDVRSEDRRRGHGAEGLMLADREQRLGERLGALPQLLVREVGVADVEGHRNGHILDRPGAHPTLVTQGRAPHRIQSGRDQVHVGRRRQSRRIHEGQRGIRRRDGPGRTDGRGVGERSIHPLVPFQGDSDAEDLRGKGAVVVGVVTRGQDLAEKVHALGDGGVELDDQARHRQTIAAIQLHAHPPHIDIVQHVVAAGPVEHVLPVRVPVGSGQDAMVLGAQ